MRQILLYLSLLLFIMENADSITMKMTNAVCETYNETWVTFSQCRLRAVNRNKTTLNIKLDVAYPVHFIDIRLQIQKRGNGYKPWLFDIKLDACKFLEKKTSNAAVRMIWLLFKDFSTVNHTCPYFGNQELKDFYPKPEKLLNPFPTGDYLFILSFDFIKKRTFTVKVYFSFVEDF